MRTLVPILLGAAAGALVVATIARPGDTQSRSVTPTAASFEPATRLREIANVGNRTLEAYVSAAEFVDAASIEARLEALFAQPFSLARDAEIAALFEKLSAIDLRRALRVAETPGFDVDLMSDVLRGLAEVDREAALQALAAVRNPLLQIELAVALLATVGLDAEGIALIAEALPENRRAAFQIEALGEFAKNDPDGALRTVLALGDMGIRSAAAQRIAVEWAHQDPITAFEMRNTLPIDLRESFRDSVATEWARLDSGDFLAYANTQATLDDMLMGLMHTIAVDPERTFDVASTHPQLVVADPIGAQFTIERTSFTSAAELDPERYRAIIETMPAGPLKQRLGPAFIEMYSRVSPEEAIAWARTQDDASYEARVIRNVAPVNHELAYRWFKEYAERTDFSNPAAIGNIVSFLGVFAATDAGRADFASRLLSEGEDRSATIVLDRMLAEWVPSEPRSALEWMLDNGTAVDPNLAASIAASLASRDAKLAADYMDRLPPELRQTWMQRVAGPFAAQDPQGATTWLAQLQGQPGYESAFQSAVTQVARTDPSGAALMLGAAPRELQTAAIVSNLAIGFAREDLAGAARWASGLNDDEARSTAISQVASSWALRDPQASQRWAVSLPRGETRDHALSSVLSGLSRDGFQVAIQPRIFDAFASETVREQQLTQLIGAIASEDPERAGNLLDDWVSDPDLRSLGRQVIEEQRD